MDTRNKIDKLKALHTHRKDREAAALLTTISKAHKEHADVRNTIAHAQLLGASKSHPDEAYFMTSRPVSDRHGFMKILRVPVADMKSAAHFARDRSRDIRALLKAKGIEV